MRRRLELQPMGFTCHLADCPPGFFLYDDYVCFKTGYHEDIYLPTGEAFWGGTNHFEDRGRLIVQPLVAVWVEDEE